MRANPGRPADQPLDPSIGRAFHTDTHREDAVRDMGDLALEQGAEDLDRERGVLAHDHLGVARLHGHGRADGGGEPQELGKAQAQR